MSEVLPDDVPLVELDDEAARAFHRAVGEMLIAAACHRVDSLKSAALRTVSPYAISGPQYAADMIDHDKRQVATMRHQTIMLRTGLKMGFIDALTGNDVQGSA